ncbi:site-specific integrase [Flavobacterium antarcticum]|uniref:tyrosine-type recombinase/integrase n=1 Tax=Flavobacterium antarcticum TaxID=271155 RepID=UPI0004231DE0|nr:site-specific integrase [Flavobacterium antarcticum]
MSSILSALHQMNALVYDSVYGFGFNLQYIADYLGQHSIINPMYKRDFSIPKIYSGGLEITNWDSYTFDQQQEALKKDWYIYYSFRNPTTALLKRQNPIKGIANSYKSKKDRFAYLTVMRTNLEKLLMQGANPYQKNDFSYLDGKLNNKPLVDKVKSKKVAVVLPKVEFNNNAPVIENKSIVEKPVEVEISIKEAFEIVLKLKKNMMNETSYQNFQGRINKFKNALPDINKPITSITKLDVVKYLNEILERTSPRNRNNNRTDLSSFFKELENNEFIPDNFVAKIPILKAIPERNKTFSDALQKDIYDYLEIEDKTLLLFIKFISYGYLRPIEICRLKIKDIDLVENRLHVRAKNQPVKIKIIPEILLKELPDLSVMNPDHYLFTPNGYAMECETKENNRRDYFSKRFNEVVKKKFELNKDYTLYSFRHTYITRLYRKLRETHTPQVAKSMLMLITGHATISALEKYLRDIDAELPEDFSSYLE